MRCWTLFGDEILASITDSLNYNKTIILLYVEFLALLSSCALLKSSKHGSFHVA